MTNRDTSEKLNKGKAGRGRGDAVFLCGDDAGIPCRERNETGEDGAEFSRVELELAFEFRWRGCGDSTMTSPVLMDGTEGASGAVSPRTAFVRDTAACDITRLVDAVAWDINPSGT